MGKINIEDVIITPLNKINNPKGDIFHGLKKSDDGFLGFGEAYFSIINNGEIKGWNRHKKMTLNLIVPFGEVTFVIYDTRNNSISSGNYFRVDLSPSNYKRLTVPPRLWIAFKGINNKTNLILNISDMEHDSKEIEKLDLDQIDYNWDSI
tara:strand:- start:532 stop:981 length:450 start_codon:yes stop_codon:yes gene_type:complete